MMRYSAISTCGKVRKENQDRIYLNEVNQYCDFSVGIKGIFNSDIVTIAVFDGMGGELMGGKAAEIAVKLLNDNCNIDFDILCRTINKKICEYMEKKCIQRMGSTAVLARINGSSIDVCNIGDSKAFLIRDCSITQISVDHTVTIGRVKPRRVLTQHLGIPEDEMEIEPFYDKIRFDCGDKILLCSDGLTDMIDENEMLQIISNASVEQCAMLLHDRAMENGGKDNISIIICEKG